MFNFSNILCYVYKECFHLIKFSSILLFQISKKFLKIKGVLGHQRFEIIKYQDTFCMFSAIFHISRVKKVMIMLLVMSNNEDMWKH